MSTLGTTIGVITIPLNRSGIVPLTNLIDVLKGNTSQLHLVSGDAGFELYANDREVTAHEVRGVAGRNALEKIFNNALTQVRMALHVMRLGRTVDIWILFMGAETLIIPHIAAKCLRRKTVLLLSGSFLESHAVIGDSTANAIACASNVSYMLASDVVVYSKRNIEQWGLEKYSDKIIVSHRHFVDLSEFPMKDRQPDAPIIGYVGRLSREKGISNLIEAIPIALSMKNDLRFTIIGDGPLRVEIEEFAARKNLRDRVEILGWVDHDEMAAHLRRMRLLVIPSYTEGLSNVALEAMASGTPVLTTGVGGMPDVITDGVTGFILKDNKPESIAASVVSLADSTELERVVLAARRLIETEFTKEVVETRWKTTIRRIQDSRVR